MRFFNLCSFAFFVLGVVAVVVSDDCSFYSLMLKVIPALAMGNTRTSTHTRACTHTHTSKLMKIAHHTIIDLYYVYTRAMLCICYAMCLPVRTDSGSHLENGCSFLTYLKRERIKGLNTLIISCRAVGCTHG